MKILDPEKIFFTRDQNTTLDITLEDGSVVENVYCVRLFPLTEPRTYISIVHRKDNQLTEIGIIKHLKQLPSQQQALVIEDIRLRYFVPEIRDIIKIIPRHGLFEWHVVTERGNKPFFLRSSRENIHTTEGGMIIITDVEKCRYIITNLRKLPKKAQIELDKVLL